MLNSFKLFLLENKTDKYSNNLKKIINNDKIINYIITKCGNDGLQYTVLLANNIINTFKENYNIDNYKLLLLNKYPDIIKQIDFFQVIFNSLKGELDYNITYILDWIKSPARTDILNINELKTKTIEDMRILSWQWHNSLKIKNIINENGEIIMTFDDGYYWIDLKTNSSRDEANAMGHCGRTTKGTTLLSLRDDTKEPHVTVAYNENEGIIYQMKGKQNKKPVDKFYKYILALLLETEKINVKSFNLEYDIDEDFTISDFNNKDIIKIINNKPSLITDSENYDKFLINTTLSKGYIEQLLKLNNNIEQITYVRLIDKNIFTTQEFLKFNENKPLELDTIFIMLDEKLMTLEEIKENFQIMDNYKDYNEYLILYLHSKKIIPDESMPHIYDNFYYKDEKLYLTFEYRDLEILYDRYSNYEIYQLKILFGLYDFDWESYPIKSIDDFRTVWGYIKLNDKKRLIDKYIKNNTIIIDKDDEDDEDNADTYEEILVKDDMIFYYENIKEYYILYKDEKYFIDDELIWLNRDDKLENMFNIICQAAKNSYNLSYENECFERIKRNFEKSIGDFEIVTINKTDYIKIKYEDFIIYDVLEYLESYYGDKIHDDAYFGDISSILSEMNLDLDVNMNHIYADVAKISEYLEI
jgi:hypothetical protein